MTTNIDDVDREERVPPESYCLHCLAVRIQIHELVRAREEGTGGVHLLDAHTFERRLDRLLDEYAAGVLSELMAEINGRAAFS